MRVLAISDEVTTAFYTNNLKDVIGEIDLLLGCGDLPYSYMEYMVTQTRVKHAYYVHGNHDRPQRISENRILEKPGGWQNVDGKVAYDRQHRLLVAGLEGSITYAPRASYQYTETEMVWRALRLVPQLLINRILHGRYLDILITHSPPQGIHDHPSGAHQGFAIFLRLMRWLHPRIMLHGHTHRYGLGEWHTWYEKTQVVNVHPFCLFTLAEDRIEFELPHAHSEPSI